MTECDSNTKYFQLVANGKYRNLRIFQRQHEVNVIEGEAALKQHITRYYKNLFEQSEINTLSPDESRMDDIPHDERLSLDLQRGRCKSIGGDLDIDDKGSK
jgi:hypothetical protein